MQGGQDAVSALLPLPFCHVPTNTSEQRLSTGLHLVHRPLHASAAAAHLLLLAWNGRSLDLHCEERRSCGCSIQFNVSFAPQDTYQRRISHVLGSRASAGGARLAVNFACAGQLDEFRQVGHL
jgi:hypothetical protein